MNIKGKLIKYKLTSQRGTTYGGFSWMPVGDWKTVTVVGSVLCSDAVLHFYDHPLVAVLMNEAHANIGDPCLWEIEVDGVIAHDGTKGGTKRARLLRKLDLPTVTTEQRVRFAILCALHVYHEPGFVTWANRWLSNIDRTSAATYAVSAAADAATYAANAADAASAADAAYAAASAAAYAAADAAAYAAYAADAADAASAGKINLVKLAKKACE